MARRPSKSSGSKPVTKPVGVLRIVAPSKPSAAAAAPKSMTTTETIAPDANDLSLSSLTLDVPLRPLVARSRRVPATPFHFLTLPSEIRIRIYEYYFSGTEPVIDLGPDNYKRYHKKLGLVRVCRQVHDEATHLFYSSQTFRVFPTHPGRFLKSKKPLLSKFKPVQRQCITSLEVRLGPEWRSPPQGWVVKPALGLHECVNVKKLNVMVECDPSDAVFKGFRRSEGFYEGFCRNLITDVIGELPNVDEVEFDAWPSVKKSGGMMRGLIKTVEELGLDISWGPLRGWTDADEEVHEEKRLANHLPPGDPYFDLSHWITAS